MTIELKKKIELTGEIWFNVWASGECIKSFSEQGDAIKFYHECVKQAKAGYPKETTIATTTIEPIPKSE